MKITLDSNYRLPSGKAIAKAVAGLLRLQRKETLAYIESAPMIAHVSLAGWRDVWRKRLLPLFAYYVIRGWKFNHDRLRRVFPKVKKSWRGLLRCKEITKEDKERYGMMAIMALLTDWMRDEIEARVSGAVDAILGTTQNWLNLAIDKYRSNVELGWEDPIARVALAGAAAQVFELPNRPTMIGEDEAIRAYHMGMLGVLRASGLQWLKTWFTAEDERVCPVCLPLHGVTIPVSQTFTSLPVSGAHAGIYTLVNFPPAHPSCRCRFRTHTVVTHHSQLVGV